MDLLHCLHCLDEERGLSVRLVYRGGFFFKKKKLFVLHSRAAGLCGGGGHKSSHQEFGASAPAPSAPAYAAEMEDF